MAPYYEFSCEEHGRFEVFKPMRLCAEEQRCPDCGQVAERVFSPSMIQISGEKPRLLLGNGSPGRLITSQETGGLDIFIPSLGAMEQEEVDYIAEGAIEKERARVKKNKGQTRSETQARIQAYTNLARKTKQGQRAKTIREAISQEGDRLVKV